MIGSRYIPGGGTARLAAETEADEPRRQFVRPLDAVAETAKTSAAAIAVTAFQNWQSCRSIEIRSRGYSFQEEMLWMLRRRGARLAKRRSCLPTANAANRKSITPKPGPQCGLFCNLACETSPKGEPIGCSELFVLATCFRLPGPAVRGTPAAFKSLLKIGWGSLVMDFASLRRSPS